MSQMQQESAERPPQSGAPFRVQPRKTRGQGAGSPGRRHSRAQGEIAIRKVSWQRRLRRDKQMLLMMMPGVLFLALFFYIPILGNVIAFQDYQPFLGITGSDWVGCKTSLTCTSIRTSGWRAQTPWSWPCGSWCCSSRCRWAWP